MQINSAKLIIEIVDENTGEIFTREATLGDFKEKKASSTTRTKKPKDDGSTEPGCTLLDGKILLNDRAIELCGWEPDTKIDIRFEKKGKVITPVMCVDPVKGNRLTKSHTISCRGSKNENLQEYGTNFKLEVDPDKNGYFRLIGENAVESDIIEVPAEITSPCDDIDDNIDFDLDEI